MCLLVDALRPDEEREILARRGHLNCVNPVFTDRYYRLDLSIWDEREMAKILVRLVRMSQLVAKTLMMKTSHSRYQINGRREMSIKYNTLKLQVHVDTVRPLLP